MERQPLYDKDADFKKILDKDYLVRYHAVERILMANGIKDSVSDIRQVFPYIIDKKTKNLDEKDTNNFLTAVNNLKKFIRDYHKPVQYEQMSKSELNEALLDACYSYSAKPNLEKIKAIVSAGADMNVPDQDGLSAFIHAVVNFDYAIMQFFLEQGADINTRIQYNKDRFSTVWLSSVTYRDFKSVELMLNNGASVSDRDGDGNTALHKYCSGNVGLNTLKLLVEKGTSVDAVNNNGDTALHLVCEKKTSREEVKYLIDKGSQVNALNKAKQTPLHRSAWAFHTDAGPTECLLEYRADPDLIDQQGDTPLIIAVKRENKEVIQPLLNYNARKDIKDFQQKTAYEIALEKGLVDIAKIIEPGKGETAYKNRPEYKELETTKKAIIQGLKNGRKIYRSDKEGYSYFFYQEGVFIYERYEEGQSPPYTVTYETEEKALQYLYDTNKYSYRERTELEIYKEILG